jgi:translocation and assembly module TamA
LRTPDRHLKKTSTASIWWLALCLLASPVMAQDTVPNGPQAFDLVVQATDDKVASWLSEHLDLQRYRSLSDLDDTEMARLLRDADVQARDLLATLGYFNPVLDWQLDNTTTASRLRSVQLKVNPGPQARIATVQIQWQGDIENRADTVLQRETVTRQWSLPVGDAFTQNDWNTAKTRALRQLVAERYPLGRVAQSQARVDPASNLVSLDITLDSGPEVKLGPLVITGTERYGSEQVERLARLPPGARYRQSELLEAQQRLVVSGFYDAVFVSLDPDGPPEATPVKIELKETQRQKWVLGLGVRSQSGARLTAEHTHHQLPGIQWRSVTKLAVDRDLQRMSVDLLAPPDAGLWRWNTSAQVDHEQFVGYAVQGQRWRAGRTQLAERIDRAYYAQYDAATTIGDQPGQREAISGNYAWTFRRFDSLPFPTQGMGWSLELGSGVTLGAQREPFVRWLTRGLWLQPLGRQAGRLSLRGEVGSVVSRDTSGLPATQLFVAGGDNSVRGYAPGAIGVAQSSGVVRPGQYLASGSVEWQRPFVWNQQRTEWESAVFVDAGAVADQASQLHAQLGYGVGARWRSPVGPLRIDLAYGQATQKLRLHLSVGFTF